MKASMACGNLGTVDKSLGPVAPIPFHANLDKMTLCSLVLQNGFAVIGKSAPASPENFDAEKGRLFAYEDAIKQLWPLEGYALRERLARLGRHGAAPLVR